MKKEANPTQVLRSRKPQPAPRPKYRPSGDLLSLERLEEYAIELATRHKAETRPVPAKPLLAEVSRSARILADAHTTLAETARLKLALMPGDEWLLDNYYIIRDNLAEVRVDLPRSYYLELPRLSEGQWSGLPRVYAIAWELILHTDGVVNTQQLDAFLHGYQSVQPLSTGELWAIPIMFRLTLLENLARLVEMMLYNRKQFDAADSWANRLAAQIDADQEAHATRLRIPAELERDRHTLNNAFLVRLMQRMRDIGPPAEPVLTWIEARFRDLGVTPEEAIRTEYGGQTAIQASVGNAITSLRTISGTSWAGFVERHSVVHSLLLRDPVGVYGHCDFATRNRYRNQIERISRRSPRSEEQIARLVLQFAEETYQANPTDVRRAHVGYYLIAAGAQRLRRATGYKSRMGEYLARIARASPFAVYLGSILVGTLAFLAVSLVFGIDWPHASWGWALVAALLALFPASELALQLVDQAVTLLLQPRVLPKLDLSAGIPEEHTTFVVIPTLLRNREDALDLARHVEILYLANPGPHLYFAILSDFTDSATEETPSDAPLLETISSAVRELNLRYGDSNRFYLFHRKRQWNPSEGAWMGWERKRGKLADFNALLLGRGGESFTTRVGGPGPMPRARYIITLDRDTEMPRDTAYRLVGTLAHPLNRPEIDPSTSLVTQGYGILQPRVNATWESAAQSLFSRVFSGHTGVDPYTTAVSNAYQDLFGEGIYIGKGIYDLQAFERSTGGRFPANTLLSHDLLEGSYARVGYASDIELYEDFPTRQNVYSSREHRWVRGDWQVLPWLFPTVPTRDGKERNPLSAINRWKILDNLRRSLVAATSVLLIALSWTLLPGSPLYWTLGVLVMLAFPFYSHLITSAFSKPPSAPWPRHLLAVLHQARTNLAHFALTVDFYVYRASLAVHAIVATLIRMYISHRHLLEWVTANEAQRKLGNSLPAFMREMWLSPLVALLIAIGIVLTDPSTLPLAIVLLLAWVLAPTIAYWVSKPIEREIYIATEEEKAFLRRVARKSWRYFEDFVTPAEHWLAPDNYQEDPKGELAHRSSPTNLSLLLLSTLSAYDMGYLTASEFAARVDCTLTSMEGLERFKGHFYNWYDTQTLQPLPPRYISTVDSGNLMGHLVALKQGCLELLGQPLFSRRTILGLRDMVGIIAEQLAVLEAGHRHDLQSVEELARAIGRQLEKIPASLPEWAVLLNSLIGPTVDLATEVRGRKPDQEAADNNRQSRDREAQATGSLDELAFWTERLAHGVQAIGDDLKNITPWAEMLASPHPLLVSEGQPEIAAHWRRTRALERSIPSLRGNLVWCANRISEIRRLQARIREAKLGDEGAAAIQWLERLRQRVASSWTGSEQLISRLRSLAARSTNMVRDMNFDFLYDKSRKLFTIGYNVADLRLDNSYYDLLASEARLAGYVAIARGEVPRDHWFALGRPITGQGDDLTLLSWTGTMFEYLMPNLVMPLYESTLLDRASKGAVVRQEQYGHERGVPWGISEAAFSTLDVSQNYNYRAFGVPGLGLKRGLSEDLVVAPYATMLALPIDPRSALSNLRRLSGLGMEGRYGFYEAIDFTRSRLAPNERAAVVGTFMVHHIGMSLVSINNYLHDNPIVRRFQSEPSIQATELLLQERVPLQAPVVQAHPVEVDRMRMGRETTVPVMRAYNSPTTHIPHAHILSNGRYSIMLTQSGTGYSSCGKIALTRWRDDPIGDKWGQFIYIRDMRSGKLWSAAAAPLDSEPAEYGASFTLDKVEYRRREGDIETHTEIVVSPEDDAEVRRITIANRGSRRRMLELTSYAEIVLAEQAADAAHPAFSKLFIETEYLPEHGAIIATRRPRSKDEQSRWLVHVVALENNTDTTTSLTLPAPAEYETDRALFLGRDRTAADPRAMGAAQRLHNSAGATLDPIISLRERVRIGPASRVRISFITAFADSREGALTLADKYRDPEWTSRAIRLALAHSRVQLRQLGISGDEAMEYQRLFSRMLYPRRATGPSSEMMARNTKGQSGLWPYGISGDLPILLVRISDPQQSEIVRQALHAHEYWQSKGFQADMVVLNEYPGGYVQPVQEELERLVSASHAHQMLNKPGGVHVKRADIMPEADRILLNAMARVVLLGSRGKLANQLDRRVQEPLMPPLISTARRLATRIQPAGPAHLSVPEAGFSDDGREYVIMLHDGQWTPLPWSNIIANPNFGCMVTESSLDTAWAINSQQNRLNPWSNDPVSDPPSQALYIRDEANGQFWSPTPLPVRSPGSYTVRHGQGYTVYSHAGHDLDQTLWVYVAPDDPVQILKLTLRNTSARARRLTVMYYTQWVLGVDPQTFSRYVVTEADLEHGAILARNTYNSEFADRVAFAATSARNFTFTGDRMEFLGPTSSTASPAALKRRAMSGRVGAGLEPCAAFQCPLELGPGAEQTLVFVLGQGENSERARTLAARYRQPEVAERAGEQAIDMWDRILSVVEVHTPDKNLDALANRWLLYQAISCRYWGRSAFYQGGGAYGFRDQLQDVMAFVHAAPAMAREHILRCSAHQFKEGDVQHWWHPPGGKGVRTRISDDMLWLPFVTAYYVACTGDTGILDEERPFLEAPELKPDQEDMYSLPTVSEEQGTLYEHCLRSIKRGSTQGPHGLPLMGAGDWNDGMNRVGIEGKGESIWVAWFLRATLESFLPVALARNDNESANRFRAQIDRLAKAIEGAGWDGEWYRRAYYDDGAPLGSASDEDCKIDSIAQSWSIIGQSLPGAGDADKAKQAMASVNSWLVREKERLLLLLTPPFDKGPRDPGYIKGYPPGIRENGGQYTHAAVWAVIARALLGDGDEAYRLCAMLNPANHAAAPDGTDIYKVEPYVIAADIYSNPQHVGRGGWTWYTGSASWYYRLIVEYILGLKRQGEAISIEPCLPSHWPGYSLTYRYAKSVYRISVENKQGAGTRGRWHVEIDGTPVDDGKIPLRDDGKEHDVSVTPEDVKAMSYEV